MASKVWEWKSTSVKLSCENNFFFFAIENLTLTKMDRLTITQLIKMIKTDSATATYRALSEDYGLPNRLSSQAIGKIAQKFEETGVVTNIERPVRIIVSPFR